MVTWTDWDIGARDWDELNRDEELNDEHQNGDRDRHIPAMFTASMER